MLGARPTATKAYVVVRWPYAVRVHASPVATVLKPVVRATYVLVSMGKYIILSNITILYNIMESLNNLIDNIEKLASIFL